MAAAKFGKGCASRVIFHLIGRKSHLHSDWLQHTACDCWIRRISVRENLEVGDYKTCAFV